MKTKYLIGAVLLLLVMIIGGIVLVSYNNNNYYTAPWIPDKPKQGILKTKPVDLSNISTDKLAFAKYYSLDPLDIELKAAQYNLPLKISEISNYKDFSKKISLDDEALSLLNKNGFAVVDNPFNSSEEDITEPYNVLKDKEIPVFITSDSLLHLYHIQFDETLRQIEEREFYDNIWKISEELLNESEKSYWNGMHAMGYSLSQEEADLFEADKRNIIYLSVGLELLKPKDDQVCPSIYGKNIPDVCKDDAGFTKIEVSKYTFEIPDFVKEEVEKELALIEDHKEFSNSPLFVYKEDYSQYVPRGHYTRSEKLKNYFKAMMWYGRTSMLLKGTDQVEVGENCNDFPPCKALISLYDARIQTMQASLLASEFAENEDLKSKWDRIYGVTAFYVGLSDDLGPYEYLEAMNFVFGDEFNPNDLTEENLGKLKAKLAEYSGPEIYGGTGEAELWPPFSPEQADEVLEHTKGFRLMGQRFIPDSYLFSNIVSPFVGSYAGKNCENTFTCEMTQGGPQRVFPRGLDVMSLLGSKRAGEILIELGDTEYEGTDKEGNNITYETQFNKFKKEFDGFTEADWQKNLYWSWLDALKPLLKEFGDGYPTFMQTEAWQEKELTSALASWAELRHDTILYAKQSYTMTLKSSIPLPEKPVVGYIEPVPEFYNKLLALTRMTNKGLTEMEVLDNSAKYRLESLEKILKRLVELSKKELENEELTKDDYAFIKNFGEKLNGVIADVDEKAKKTTIIADVHTDQNTKQVLEEGVGYVKMILVAYKVPDGRILIGAGPVMSYYEFKHPMDDRLTDEKWRELLKSNPPSEPEWVDRN